jgi:beta-glucosidase
LPLTFYRNSDNLGDFEDYSMKGRTYRYTTDYLFPFGFGLSYTNFEIGTASLSKSSIKADETISISIPVKNTGKLAGTEIVQVYVRKVNDVEGPLKTLRGFQRMEIAAGKASQATISLPPSTFEFYDWSQRKMAVTPGEYEVYYGNSSDAKDLKMLKIKIN